MKTTNGFAIAAVVILSGGGVGCKSSSTPAQASLPSERTYSQLAAAAPGGSGAGLGGDTGWSGLASYRGPGYKITYPANWERNTSGPTLNLDTTLNGDDLRFALSPVAASGAADACQIIQDLVTQSMDSPVQLGNSQKTVYGRWQGDTLDASGMRNGVPTEVACTAIRANDHWYMFAMIVPSRNMWAGFKVRAALADALEFDSLPEESQGKGVECRNCGQIVIDTMNSLTHNSATSAY